MVYEGKDAWNDTFVHPGSTHWLKGGPRLPIMGLTRMGVTDRLDVGVYFTKSPGVNYGPTCNPSSLHNYLTPFCFRYSPIKIATGKYTSSSAVECL